MQLFLPAFCGMLVLLVLMVPDAYPDAGRPAGAFLLLGSAALGGTLLARRVPRLAPMILVAGAVALLFAIYTALSLVAPWILPEDREWFALRVDRMVLGYTWERWWSGIQSPWLTDLLQAVYTSFYGFPLILGIWLAARRDWYGLYGGLDRMILGFLLSYCGYLLVPTRSPYPFVEYAAALPHGSLRPLLHHGIVEMAWTKRDCFPSGHTMMSLTVAWLACLRARPVAWLLVPWALLTITATLYLRYHYLVDVLAGLAAFLVYTLLCRGLFGPYSPRRVGPGGEAAGPPRA